MIMYRNGIIIKVKIMELSMVGKEEWVEQQNWSVQEILLDT